MEKNEEKKCIICSHLKLEEESCPIKPFVYFCATINELIYSTRKVSMNLEKLDKFYCNFFKRDLRKK